MSEILNAVNSVKPLIQALDGLRLIAPLLETLGSLEQATKEIEASKFAAQKDCSEAKEELKKLNVDLASVKSQIKELIKETKEKVDKKILEADQYSHNKIKESEAIAAELINSAESVVKKLYEKANSEVCEHKEKHETLLKDIESEEKKLTSIREMISKFTSG